MLSEQSKIAVFGATGYLGSHIIKELQTSKLDFLAFARSEKKLHQMNVAQDQIRLVQVTEAASLKDRLNDVDVIISTVGITRQQDGLTYMDVDYQANLNILNEAKRAGVKKFIYVSAINGRRYRNLKIMQAKEAFVDKLIQSGMDYCIVRPNGFFSDMKDFLNMAKGGKVYLFGDGECKLNPIHGADLAKACLELIFSNKIEFNVGGPDVLTQNEIARLALEAYGKEPKIVHIPDSIRRLIIGLMRFFLTSKMYGPFEFFLTLMAYDNVGTRYGEHHLKDFYNKVVLDKNVDQ